jgi:hypothetical protein
MNGVRDTEKVIELLTAILEAVRESNALLKQLLKKL